MVRLHDLAVLQMQTSHLLISLLSVFVRYEPCMMMYQLNLSEGLC